MTATPYLSVVIPVYNESKRIGGIARIADYLRQQPFSSEIVVVNDGSTDDTLDQLRAYQQQFALQVVHYQPNRGKGYALRQGMLAACGEYRLFTDVDLSTPIEEFAKFVPLLSQYDVLIASRRQHQSQVTQHQPKLRETLGQGFTLLSRTILQVPVSDFTCGFKCFSARAAESVFSRLTIERWGFDSEALFLTHRSAFRIREIPVIWQNDPRSKVKLPDDLIRSLSELLTIRLNALRGVYKRPNPRG